MITQFNIFENYIKWEDDKKILHLGELFDHFNGDLQKIFDTLKHELRNSEKETTLIKSYDNKINIRIINVIDWRFIEWKEDTHKEIIVLKTNKGEKHLHLNSFYKFYIEIYKRRVFSVEDPYGEEDWD